MQFDYEKIADLLFKMANKKFCLERNRKSIYDLVKKFRALSKGVYPIDDFNLSPLRKEKLGDEEFFLNKNKKSNINGKKKSKKNKNK